MAVGMNVQDIAFQKGLPANLEAERLTLGAVLVDPEAFPLVGGELTAEQKQFNRELAQERVVIEHIIRHLKIFRILAQRYRNRRRRFMLRVNLIAGLYNYVINRHYLK